MLQVTSLEWPAFTSYIATLLVFFGTLKAVNSYLHHTFDYGSQVQKQVEEPAKGLLQMNSVYVYIYIYVNI